LGTLPPERPSTIEPVVFIRVKEKALRRFVEYPAAARAAGVERAVVASDWSGEALPPGRLLAVEGLHYVPLPGATPHLRRSARHDVGQGQPIERT
jgi:hypothetical protein